MSFSDDDIETAGDGGADGPAGDGGADGPAV